MTNQTSNPAGAGGIVEGIIGAAARAIEGIAATAIDTTQIHEQMEVIGSDGQHVGVVDRVEGDKIKLARSDPASGGQHHYVPVGQVESVVVRLAQPADEARRLWETEQNPPTTDMR